MDRQPQIVFLISGLVSKTSLLRSCHHILTFLILVQELRLVICIFVLIIYDLNYILYALASMTCIPHLNSCHYDLIFLYCKWSCIYDLNSPVSGIVTTTLILVLYSTVIP